jgi:hypothetical protein
LFSGLFEANAWCEAGVAVDRMSPENGGGSNVVFVKLIT